MRAILYTLSTCLLIGTTALAQKKEADVKTPQKPDILQSSTYGALAFRNIGPAVTSGRIVDIAVNPRNQNEWYIAAACGGVFKTQIGRAHV